MLSIAPVFIPVFAVCSLATTSEPADPAIRHEVDMVLRDMAAAVTAGDAEAYLAHVWRGDPNFVNEQKYFANDLRKRKPVEFAYTLGEEKFEVGDGTARGDLTMTWKMEDDKEPRSVEHAVQFILADGQWRYAGEVWEKFESDRCVVFFDPGFEEVAKTTAEILPEVRRHVHAGFEFSNESPLAMRTQEIKLYPTMKHLQASITLSYRDGLSGWNEPGEAIKLLVGRRREAASLKGLLAHEYGHVATFELGPKSNLMPWWLLEGIAELSSEHFSKSSRRADAAVRRWAAAGKLADWDKIADFENTENSLMGHVYTQGHQFLGYVSERFGRTARNEWMRRMSNGATLDGATRAAFGVSFAQLDQEWRGSVAEQLPEGEADQPRSRRARGDGENAGDKKPGEAEAKTEDKREAEPAKESDKAEPEKADGDKTEPTKSEPETPKSDEPPAKEDPKDPNALSMLIVNRFAA